jgi:hypothetical protein
MLEDTGLQRQRPLPEITMQSAPTIAGGTASPINLKRVPPTGWGTSPGQSPPPPEIQAPQPIQPSPGEIQARQTQAADIAARTNQAQHDAWNTAMRQKLNYGGPMEHRSGDMLGTPPLPRDVPPAGNDPYYAIQGLQGNIAQAQREQAQRAIQGRMAQRFGEAR